MIESILFYLFTGVSGILLLFYLFIHVRVAFHKPTSKPTPDFPISVIVAARNEIQNLKTNLPSLLQQDYSKYEIVVVDDGSWDGSGKYVESLQKEHSNIKLVSLNIDERFHRGKKFALTMGMKGAKYDHFVFTDADCKPASDQWLKIMSSEWGSGEITIGHSPVKKANGLASWMSSINHSLTGMHFLGFALAKKPYMGVGRNLGYTRDLFFSGKGFSEHIKLMSGDDDLFVNDHTNKENTNVVLHPEAFVWTSPPSTMSAFIKQKKRHHSTVRNYRISDQIHLALYHTSQILFYYLLIILLGLHVKLTLVLIIAGIKTGLQWIIQGVASYKLGDKRTAWSLPFADLAFVIQSVLLIPSVFKKPNSWN
jgi:cellulose synthase/poly-beta-1,6-N-acetylglucosamine synthase-like glycosyltransferase